MEKEIGDQASLRITVYLIQAYNNTLLVGLFFTSCMIEKRDISFVASRCTCTCTAQHSRTKQKTRRTTSATPETPLHGNTQRTHALTPLYPYPHAHAHPSPCPSDILHAWYEGRGSSRRRYHHHHKHNNGSSPLPLPLEEAAGPGHGDGLIQHPLADVQVLLDPDVDVLVLRDGVFLETGPAVPG